MEGINEKRFDFWDKIGMLFSDPNRFFEKVKDEPWTTSLVAFLLTLVVVSALQIVAGMFFMRAIGSMFGLASGMGIFGSFFSIGTGIIGIVFAFIYVGIVHIVVKMFKGERGYTETFKVYAYSMIPAMIIGLVPLLGYIGWIYGIVLGVMGLKIIQKISTGQAVVAILSPLIVIFAIVIFIIGFFLIGLGRAF